MFSPYLSTLASVADADASRRPATAFKSGLGEDEALPRRINTCQRDYRT